MTDAAAPAPTPRGLSVAQQVLVNSLGFLAVQVIEDDRWPLVLAVLDEALAAAPRDTALAERLCAAAEAIRATAPLRNRPGSHADWAMAMMATQAVLAEVFFWRGGLALDALRAAPPTPKEVP